MKKILLILACAMLLPILTFCGEKHSDPVKLAAPTLTLNSETGDAAWSAIEGATGYKYKIGDTQKVVDSSILAVRILNGESVSVMAIGDGEKYLDSDWSEPVSLASVSKLAKPKITTQKIGTQYLLTWEKDANATSYVYRLNSGAETPIDKTQYLINSGDIFRLKALGDEESFVDSDWTVIQPQ